MEHQRRRLRLVSSNCLQPYLLRPLFVLQHSRSEPGTGILPRLRFSVALPLGINGDRAARPGLPQQHLRRTRQRRQPRIQLGFIHQKYEQQPPRFLHDTPQSHQRKPPRLRFSAAVPLGINRGRAAIESRLGLPQPTAASPPTPKDCRLSENNRRKTSPPPQQSPRTAWSCEKKTLS